MIAIRLAHCAGRSYGEILKIIQAPITDEAATALKSILPDLRAAPLERGTYHAGGRFYVRGDLVGWTPNAPPPPPATLLAKAKSLAGAAAGIAGNMAKGHNPLATPELASSRLQICQGCPMLSGGACSRCGCPVAHKTAVASERCPDGKW
jgi:hypothetical protein